MNRRLSILLLLCVALAATAAPASAQGAGRFYPETGHTLEARFVDFFDGQGGLAILGYPITDAFVDPYSGLLIQYTQNARMELAPVLPEESWLPRLMPLGEAMGGWDAPLDASQAGILSNPRCQYFDVTGHQVCHAFLDFYQSHGAAAYLGYPISEFRIESDRLVQYTQGFRLDWHPESGAGGQVEIAPLGRLHFEQSGYDHGLLRPQVPSSNIAYLPLSISASSSVAKPVASGTDVQSIFIVVRDQNGSPVRGASAFVVAHFPSGDRTLILPPTDHSGMSLQQLSFTDQPMGANIELEIWVALGDMVTVTRDGFRIWW